VVIRIYELRFSNYDCALALKKIKKFGWWSLGILLLAAFIVAMGAGNSRDPFEMVVAGRTNDTSGSWIMVAISNRTQRTFSAYVIRESLMDGEWRSVNAVDRETGLPMVSPDVLIGPEQSNLSLLPAPETGERWRVAVVGARKPGPVESLIIRGFGKFRAAYPLKLDVAQVLEEKR